LILQQSPRLVQLWVQHHFLDFLHSAALLCQGMTPSRGRTCAFLYPDASGGMITVGRLSHTHLLDRWKEYPRLCRCCRRQRMHSCLTISRENAIILITPMLICIPLMSTTTRQTPLIVLLPVL
jgi:hypothetical protein